MFKGYKTVAFNVLMSLVTIITMFNPGSELPDAETVQGGINAVEAAVVAVWTVGNLILRAVTDSPIFKKDSTNA